MADAHGVNVVSLKRRRRHNKSMSTTPSRPGTEPEVSDREKRIIEQRLATFDEDRKTAVDAKEALASIRKSLQDPVPR